MVKSKKILSLALALVMALGVLTMGVFAAKTTPTATFTVSASAWEEVTTEPVQHSKNRLLISVIKRKSV